MTLRDDALPVKAYLFNKISEWQQCQRHQT